MKWRRSGTPSRNLEDRRGQRRSGAARAGMVGIPAIIVALIAMFLGGGSGQGGGLGDLLEGLNTPPAQQAPPEVRDPDAPDPDADLVAFVSFILDDTQGTWQELFAAADSQYQDARLVVFEDFTQSGCGGANSQVGPHYCPLDQTVYLDLDFFRQLERQFDASGDFAAAYVIAHEVAHHVQNIVGIMDEVRQLQQQSPDQRNDLSIALELQADCFAGVWARTTYQRDLLERGDLQEGITAAEAVGDDRIQESVTGQINRETWTHGSSDQRRQWFMTGFDTGDPNACDTFG